MAGVGFHQARLPADLRFRFAALVFFAALTALAIFGAAGCRGGSHLTAQQAEGQHLYEVRCAHCHRDNDLGLKKPPPDLHDLFRRSTLPSGAPATDAQVAHVVLAGKGLMPSFAGRFTDAQMAALLAYLHTGLR
jgi:mono/diheme cytochrome c family protein